MIMETDELYSSETDEILEALEETTEAPEESTDVPEESTDVPEETTDVPEETISQEILVNFDNISLSTSLNDLGLVGVTLLCVVLILSLTLVWGYNKS